MSMQDPLTVMERAEDAFLRLYPWHDQGSVPLHMALFGRRVDPKIKKSFLRGTFIEFGDVQNAHGMVFEEGAQIAHKSGAPTEELIKWSTPEDFGRASELWDLATAFAVANVRAFKSVIGIDPPNFSHLHTTTVYWRHGVDPLRKADLERANRARLKVPDDMPIHVGLAALHLNAGAVLAREHPTLIEGRFIGAEIMKLAGDIAYRDARRWAEQIRPDLRYLFAK